MKLIAIGADAIPIRKAIRQPISPKRGDNNPPRIPLIPNMRPLIKINAAEASPSKIPPPSDSQGVK
jgi:hypothetical protein